MIKSGNYITIIGWMRKLLNLSLEEMVVYAIIYGFSQDKEGSFSMSVPYLVEWTGKSDRTIRDILDKLENKGVIKAEIRSGKTTLYKSVPLNELEGIKSDDPCKICSPAKSAVLQNLQPTPANAARVPLQNLQDKYINNNKNYIKAGGESARALTHEAAAPTFLLEKFNTWWLTYGMPEWEGEKEECKRIWFRYSAEEIKRVEAYTKIFAPINLSKNPKTRKHPVWFLKDKIWLNDLSTMGNAEIPTLSGAEADLAKDYGREVWNCKMPDGTFKLVLKEDADKFGLEKTWKL